MLNMTYDSRAIANFFLDYADSHKVELSPLALQKLLYFSQGWHLAIFDHPLVKNGFEAWERGPVLRIVYDCFKRINISAPIKTRAKTFDPINNLNIAVEYELSVEEEKFLEKMFSYYGYKNAYELSDLSHERGGPWDLIWNGSPENNPVGMRIDNSLIKEHFLTSIARESIH